MFRSNFEENMAKAFFVTILVGVLVALAGGWVANIVKLVGTDPFWPLSGLGVARVIGIFIAPIGAILGFI
jgi:hypothetical protein